MAENISSIIDLGAMMDNAPQHDNYLAYLTGFSMLSIYGFLVFVLSRRRVGKLTNFPPVVKLSHDEMFNDPVKSYERIIREHGGIVAVKRKGKMEVVVDERYVTRVLTDDANFSFELGTADAMNLNMLLHVADGKFFKIAGDMVEDLLARRVDDVVQQVAPIYLQGAKSLVERSGSDVDVDIFDHCQSTVSEAMVVLLFGKKFVNPDNNLAVKMAVNDFAELTGMYQNRSFYARNFPAIWRLTTFVKIVIVRFGLGLMFFLGRPIWSEMTFLMEDPETYKKGDDRTVLSLLVRRFAGTRRRLSIADRGIIYLVLISVMFASVHQVASTMVWVLCELALRPEYKSAVMEEIRGAVSSETGELNHEYVKNAVQTDSFIREVMRTKGDTFSVTRITTRDVKLGQYIIPKGFAVYPNAYLAHTNAAEVGEAPEKFDGKRGLKAGKPAAMAGAGHLAFGLGRWVCPGRLLAIAEIKLMVFSLLHNADIQLRGNNYKVIDPLLTASAPPDAAFILTERVA